MQVSPRPDDWTRRWVARFVMVIYVILLFEGVLRKWIFPGVHQYLVFLRDPFILLIYFFAWKKAFRNGYPRELKFGLSLAGLSIFLVLFQEFNFSRLTVFVYGWRNYFLPVALPFVMREMLHERDLLAVIRYSLILAIPVAFLSVWQSVSSPDDPINQGFGGAFGAIFQALPVGFGFYRTQGLFTSIAGQVMMIGSCAAMALGMWIVPPKHRPVGIGLLIASTLGIFAMLGVSGSRTAFVVIFLILGLTILSSLFWLKRGTATKALVFPIILAVCGGFVIMYYFQSQFEALAYRVKTLETAQTGYWGVWEIGLRISSDLAVVFWAFENLPLWGYGLGTATNAGFMAGTATAVVEGEWGRNLVDLGPILGLGFIFFRWILLWRVFKDAINAVRTTNNPLPIFFAAFVSFTLFNGYLTAQNTVSGYGWLFTGFALTSSNIDYLKAKDSKGNQAISNGSLMSRI